MRSLIFILYFLLTGHGYSADANNKLNDLSDLDININDSDLDAGSLGGLDFSSEKDLNNSGILELNHLQDWAFFFVFELKIQASEAQIDDKFKRHTFFQSNLCPPNNLA